MQQGMQTDQGSAFESTFTRHSDGSELKVTKCPYNDILHAEGKPQLLSVCCCSQDASWCAPAPRLPHKLFAQPLLAGAQSGVRHLYACMSDVCKQAGWQKPVRVQV